MKLQLLAMSCMVATAAAAHDNLAVKYRVSDHDTDAGNLRTTEMTLVADNEKSLYYNTMSLYVDSCMSTPEGAARLREIQLKAWRVEHPDGTVTYDGRKLGLAPDKLEYLYVAKDRKAATVDVFDMKSDELCRYTESTGDMQWREGAPPGRRPRRAPPPRPPGADDLPWPHMACVVHPRDSPRRGAVETPWSARPDSCRRGG